MEGNWSCLGGSECSDPTEEPQKGCGIVRHPVIRPGSEVELSQLVRAAIISVL